MNISSDVQNSVLDKIRSFTKLMHQMLCMHDVADRYKGASAFIPSSALLDLFDQPLVLKPHVVRRKTELSDVLNKECQSHRCLGENINVNIHFNHFFCMSRCGDTF